jgi:hypothetical protein
VIVYNFVVKRAAMAQIVTIKELEEKYGWGFVVFKNLPVNNSSFPSEGEYVFHSQTKSDCWDLVDDTNSQQMGIFPFGTNPEFANVYPMLSPLFVVREDSVEYKKPE